MTFANGEMVVRFSDLRVGFVTRVQEIEGEVRYRVRFAGFESSPMMASDLLPADGL